MVRPAVIEVGVGVLAVGVLAYFLISPIVSAPIALGGVLVTLYGFTGPRDNR